MRYQRRSTISTRPKSVNVSSQPSRDPPSTRRASKANRARSSGDGVSKPDMDSDADVTQYVAEIAAKLQDRLAQVSSGIQLTLENEIPELGGDRGGLGGLGRAGCGGRG